MSEEEYASKRERQKARRADRLDREAAQAKTQAGRQRLVYAGIIGVVVLLIGGLVFSQINARQQRNELTDAVSGRLGELGCTEDTRMPGLGGGHIPGDEASLTAESPATIYGGDEPPSSGRHIGQVVATGVYDVPVDPRLTTHNLEHGYIVAHYAEDAPAEEIEALKAWAQEQIDGNRPKVVVAPYYLDMVEDANFSFTAWFQRQTCDTFDEEVAEVFSAAHYDVDGEGPEKGIPTHTIGAQGVLAPEEGDEGLFLPPLDAEFGTGSAIEEVEGQEPATDELDPSEGAADGGAADESAPAPVEEPTE